jgi:hypothetical protein
MKPTCVAVVAVLLAACGTSELDPNTVRATLPTAEAVALRTAAADAPPAVAGVQSQALGDTPSYKSEYAIVSYWTAVSVNVGVGSALGLLKLITAFPPTKCAESSCTWGPAVDDAGLNRWRLVVEKTADTFAYVLAAQNGVTPGDFVPLLTGVAHPGPDRDHGRGTFTLDFDAEDALAHGPLWEKKDFGKVTIDYDNLDGVSIGAVLLNGKNAEDATRMNAVYAFEDRGAGGELQIAVENLTTTETFSLRTRWDADGAGRGDVQYSGQDGALGNGDDAYASECWAGEAFGFVEQYDSFPEFGLESLCVFQPALYANLSLP